MLTPVDIENKVFKKAKIGGYDIDDVEDFLEKIIDDYETLYKKANEAKDEQPQKVSKTDISAGTEMISLENTELKEKITKLENKVAYYKNLEQGISTTIENAQEESEKIVSEAREEADRILSEAKKEAEGMRAKAEAEAKDSIKDIEKQVLKQELLLTEKKKQMQIYKIRVKSMLEAQIKILDDGEIETDEAQAKSLIIDDEE
ncbi:divIVA domain protein [Clostridium sp. CAG:1219]|nr:divIVA domain protein [Clostridium sp. CAG:1219]